MRTILHVDMDAFYASVEQRDNPALRGKPVIVGAPHHQRGVVSACSYEARAFGVHSAMPSQEAWRRCPQAIFVPCDMACYELASRQIFAVFERFSPAVEPLSIDEAFIDVTGACRLFGDGRTIATKIRTAIRSEIGLPASVGVAHNKFLAKLASQRAKPDGILEMPHDLTAVVAMLGKLEVGALWGVGRVTEKRLRAAGYHFVRDIQQADPRALAELLGSSLAQHLLLLAHGEDQREVETGVAEKSISRETTFLQDCTAADHLRITLLDLVDEVGQRLRAQGHYATTGRIKIRWSDFRTITRQAPFDTPVCDDFSLRTLADNLFQAERLIQPVRLIGFGVSGFTTKRDEQLSLFDHTPAVRTKRERLCHTIDELREKLGGHAIMPRGELHTPEK